MGMTIAEKILAAHSGRKEVSPGDLINVKVDLVMANDVTAPIAIEQFRKLGVKEVFDKERVVFVPSHFVPARDIATAEQFKVMREGVGHRLLRAGASRHRAHPAALEG